MWSRCKPQLCLTQSGEKIQNTTPRKRSTEDFLQSKIQKKTVPKRKVVKRSKTYQKMQICLFILMAQMREKREGT
jgi:hypothetical protein